MDCSKDYILMCENSVEIQELAPVKLTGHKHRWNNNIHILEGKYYYKRELKGLNTTYTWLPTQSDLQGMIINKLNAGQLSMYFEDWRQDNVPHLNNNYSMEQLWLAFLYDQKYNKLWSGSDWILKWRELK